MARTAKQILMAQGYTEAEAAPILNDTRLVKALEAEDAAIEARINGFQTEIAQTKDVLAKTEKWYADTAVPTIEKTNREAVAARARVAQLEAQLKAEAELGLRRVAEQETTTQQTTQQQTTQQQTTQQQPGAEVDPRYVTSDTFKQTADQFGTAIALATDIQEDHRELFGKRLPGGVEALRAGYMKARSTGFQGNMRDYWQQEYKVDARRTELATQEAKAKEDQIRADERAKVTSEMMNPNTRGFQSSRVPWTKKVENGTTDGRMPWDGNKSREQRHSERVMKFGAKVLNEKSA